MVLLVHFLLLLALYCFISIGMIAEKAERELEKVQAQLKEHTGPPTRNTIARGRQCGKTLFITLTPAFRDFCTRVVLTSFSGRRHIIRFPLSK